MKKLIIIAVAVFSSALAYAQAESDSLKDSINDIKRDFNQFIFADATLDTEDAAKSLAKDFLVDYVKIWRKKYNITGEIDTANLFERTKYIVLRRGTQYKTFAYVAIPDILGPDFEMETEQREAADTVVQSEPVAQPDPVVQFEPVVQPEPVVEISEPETQDNVGTYYSLVSKLYLRSTKEEVIDLLESDEFAGKCTFGDVTNRTAPDSISKGILVIYEKENHKVVAALGPRSPYRVNLKTLEADSTSNYPGCGAIWIDINEK